MQPLAERHCQPPAPGTKPLSAKAIAPYLSELKDWTVDPTGTALTRNFELADFNAAMRFVNQVATIAEAEDHHPDMDIRWNKVMLTLSTHDMGGVSENDLIVAAKIDQIV